MTEPRSDEPRTEHGQALAEMAHDLWPESEQQVRIFIKEIEAEAAGRHDPEAVRLLLIGRDLMRKAWTANERTATAQSFIERADEVIARTATDGSSDE